MTKKQEEMIKNLEKILDEKIKSGATAKEIQPIVDEIKVLKSIKNRPNEDENINQQPTEKKEKKPTSNFVKELKRYTLALLLTARHNPEKIKEDQELLNKIKQAVEQTK